MTGSPDRGQRRGEAGHLGVGRDLRRPREEHQRRADAAEHELRVARVLDRARARAEVGARSPCRPDRPRRCSAARRSRRSPCRGRPASTAWTVRRGTSISAGLSPGRYGVWGSTTWKPASVSVCVTRSCVYWAASPVGGIVAAAGEPPMPMPSAWAAISTTPTHEAADRDEREPGGRPAASLAVRRGRGHRRSSGRPGHRPAAEQVEVEVVDRLAAVAARRW